MSRPGIHNLGRPGQLRRKLQIWNPFNFYDLAAQIDDGWSEILSVFDRSDISLSKPTVDERGHRALIPELSGNDLPLERARVRAVARFLLRADVARFYHSIYTHTIPWAIHGKFWAKANRSGGLGNELDRALREGQDGQTLGIPLGPDTSLVLAELIACSIDKALGDDFGTDAFRFMDDFEIGFDTRSSAERGLARLEERLAEFELAANPAKTSIQALPLELTPAWRAELRTYDFGDSEELSTRDLISYFNRVFVLHQAHPTEDVIAYAVGRLRAIKVGEGDWALYQNLLLQCAVAEPASLPTVLGQVARHSEYGTSSNLVTVLEEVIASHAPLGHGSEVGWALWAAIWLKQPLSGAVDAAIASMDDAVVALLALHARERRLISLDKTEAAWKPRLTPSELYDRGWLLAYEAIRRGWMSCSDEPEMRNDPNYGPLLAEDVSFYDEDPGTPVSFLYGWYGDLFPDPGHAEPKEPA